MFGTRTRFGLALGLVTACAGVLGAADVVVLRDGFVIQGFNRSPTDTIVDKKSGQAITVPKGGTYEMIDEGPKVTFYSPLQKQPGGVGPETKLRPDVRAFTMKFTGRRSEAFLPAGTTVKTTEFNDKWTRVVTVKPPGNRAEDVYQQVTHLDPYYLYIVSSTHLWRLTYRTSEWEPAQVRKLLMMHPEIAEPDGKCDPLKRFALAKFMLDAGWLQYAKDEMARFKRDFTGELTKEAKEQHDKLAGEIDHATAELVAREAEFAVRAGRYRYTAELLAAFPEKIAAATEVARVAKVSAELRTNRERYDTGRRLLRALIDETAGFGPVNTRAAVGGGLAAATHTPVASGPSLELALAADRVLAELHPDSSVRIETFVSLAQQAERERKEGTERTKKPEELLAAAVSGWVKGKNGATPNPDVARKLWVARELVLACQKTESLNERAALAGRLRGPAAIGPDEMAQLISLLPPADPEDLDNRTGVPVTVAKLENSGTFRRTTPAAVGYPSGLDYLVRLPAEYHHGRAYPVLIVLTTAGVNATDLLAPLVPYADKHGYILLAPEWTNGFGQGWKWRGEDHVWVTATLRDAVRHFTVDNDRVFLTGAAEGANMAMDVGLAHPDLFAGVIPMGPIPKWGGLMIETWRNAQLLPFYVITGEQSGDGLKNMRLMFDKWGAYGFPSIMSVYKGRGVEWYAAEVPSVFDWMGRKVRAAPAASLKLDEKARQRWQMPRDTDTHFYWLQADEIVVGKFGGALNPADMTADIRGANVIDVRSKGVRQLTLWLSGDMINWAEPVRVQVNGFPARGYKPRKFEPSLEVLLEDYANRGDRRMLFLNKIELKQLPP